MISLPYPKVLFLCRGSLKDGIGHVTRTRALAEEFMETAAIKVVVIGEPYIKNILSNYHFDYVIIENENNIMHHVEHFNPDIVIFDLLSMDSTIFKQVSKTVILTVSISPIFDHLQDVDLVFHRTRCVGPRWPTSSLKYCSLSYAIIGKHTRRIPDNFYRHTIQQNNLSIAISMGGTDAPNKTLKVIESLKKFTRPLLIWAILGEGYTHSYNELVGSIQDSQHEIILTKANNSMWRILNNCALLILSGGTTTYEASYAGIPTINILEKVENTFLIRELVESGVCVLLEYNNGDYSKKLNELLLHFYENRSELLKMHNSSVDLLDKNGASRIMNVVLSHFNNSGTVNNI